MTEENTLNERNKAINDATQLNRITLLTRMFGRGIDFIVMDKNVISLGGVHII